MPTMRVRNPAVRWRSTISLAWCPIRVRSGCRAAFQRQPVFYRTNEPAGTIIVDTADRYLYLVQGNNRAIRYGIGVGREGFQWQGLLKITGRRNGPTGRRRRK